jgi:DNA invertase Pin-like site-specific DNA recombinase
MQDRIAHGEIATKKITMEDARDIRRRLKYGKGKGVTQKTMAMEYNVSVSLIQRIWTNRSHKEREEPI